MDPAGSAQAARSAEVARDRPLSDAERYFLDQAEAIHRVYAPIYPAHRIHIVLVALERPQGAPDKVRLHHGAPDPQMVDADYLGTVQFEAPARLDAPDRPDTEETQDITIVAPVPRRVTLRDMRAEKTAPDFRNHPVLGRLMWRAPVLFEQGKYLYERRQQARSAHIHSFVPVGRATTRPLGRLIAQARAAKAPAILIGFHWLEMGGAETLAFDCVTWARAAGFRVLVLAERADIHRYATRLPEDAEVEFIRADAYLHPERWFEFLEELVRRENIRAIHIHHNVRLYDNLLRLKAVFPDLVTIDSTHIIEYSNGGFPRTSGVWTRYIDHHHVISRDLVAFYLDRFGVSEKVMLGRMLDPVDPAAPEPEPRFRLNAGQKSCRIVFVGRMVHQKRAPLVVEIARRLHGWAQSEGIALQVDMVGTGAYLDVVKHMIRKANLSSVVTLHPADADVPALMDEADILLLPSSNEGLALVCYEAIRHGALPISTDVGAQGELVPDSLLVARAPLACVTQTVALIRRLMREADFLARCKAGTLANYRALRADPTAQEVLSTLYTDILEGVRVP